MAKEGRRRRELTNEAIRQEVEGDRYEVQRYVLSTTLP